MRQDVDKYQFPQLEIYKESLELAHLKRKTIIFNSFVFVLAGIVLYFLLQLNAGVDTIISTMIMFVVLLVINLAFYSYNQDFYYFKVSPLHGKYAQNKDLALFPRKVNGQYAMVGRYDGVNNYIMFSDKVNMWQNAKLLQQPLYPWEFIQIGNSGSPIETPEGWLLIIHGVGPMRRYSLGAILLDLDNPEKVIGHLKSPLMVPNETEREGYVPNVIYSCGSIIHNNELIIPYAMSDYASSFVTVPVKDLLEELKNNHQ